MKYKMKLINIEDDSVLLEDEVFIQHIRMYIEQLLADGIHKIELTLITT